MWEKVQQSYVKFFDWIKAIPGGKSTLIVLFLVLVGAYIYYIHYFPWETEGEIVVDEPKLYTRERLVNDRFREEAWLNEQLTNLKREDFLTPEARISSAHTQQLTLAVNASKNNGSETGQGQTTIPSIQSDDASLEKAPQEIAATPTDTFSDMLDYRDKVRNELMRIQLDDRHDIEGNTLYRLNFDSAIIPGKNTHDSAVILVTVTPNNEEDLDSLFKEWASGMQTKVASLIDDKIKLLDNPPFDQDPFPPVEQVAFEAFLRHKICEQVKTLSIKLFNEIHPINQSEPDMWGNICPEPTENDHEPTVNPKKLSTQDVYFDCENHPEPFFCEVEKLIGHYSISYDLAKSNKVAVIFFENLKRITGLTGDKAKELSWRIAMVCGTPVKNKSRPNIVLYNTRSQEVSEIPNQNEHGQNTDPQVQEIQCLLPFPPINRLLVVMGLLERLSAVSELEPKKIRSLVNLFPNDNEITQYPKVIEELVRPYVCGKLDENHPLFHQDPYQYIKPYYEIVIKGTEQCKKSLDYPDEGIRQPLNNLKQLVVTYQATRLSQLDKYFTYEVNGCDMQQCRLVLNAKPGAHKNLIKALKDVNQSFSYAVTPQIQTQRIALLNKQKQQLNSLVNASLQGGGNKTEGLVQQLNTLEKELEMLERHPLVVGFGDWQYQEKDEEKAESDPINNETRFGWVIQPRLTGSPSTSDGPEFQQLPGHYSLSAVISIPGWWRSVTVQVNKCWLSRPKLSASISSLCGKNNVPAFNIKVPGHTYELNQKLGTEVIKNPHLLPEIHDLNHMQLIEVGRKGVVLLEGDRLWRSTVVMLDNQKADSIEVLPDMKGVSATFECVKPAAGDKAIAYEEKDKKPASEITPDTNNTSVSLQGPLNSLRSLLVQQPKEQEKAKKSTNDASAKDPTSSQESTPENCKPAGQQKRGESNNDCNHDTPASIKLWTSEGNTDSNPLRIILKPFVRRYPDDKPCYEIGDKNKQAG